MAFLRDSSLYCIPNVTFTKNERYPIGGICMASSSIGFLGAALQLKSLWKYRNRQRRWPSAHPRIIFYLALCDLFASLGVIALAICFVAHTPPPVLSDGVIKTTKYMTARQSVITALEIITIFSYLASYIWTFSYALDMSIQIYGRDCPMISHHIVAWTVPLLLVTIIEAFSLTKYLTVCEPVPGQMSRLILSYFLVPLVIFGNSLLFTLTYQKIKKISRRITSFTNDDRIALTKFKRKFFLMVFAFTICWLPNVVSVCYDLKKMSRYSEQEVYKRPHKTFAYFPYIEAILNPLQGMFNYFIYRNSFKVAALETRSMQNSLRSVRGFPYQSASQRFIANSLNTSNRHSQFSKSPDETAKQVGSGRAANTYTYISKLLGE